MTPMQTYLHDIMIAFSPKYRARYHELIRQQVRREIALTLVTAGLVERMVSEIMRKPDPSAHAKPVQVEVINFS